MASPNKELIDELQVILDQAKLSNLANDRFRIKSYRDAIDKINGVTFKITIESEIPLAKTSKIYAKVKEFIEKGQIHQSQKILTESEGLIDIYRDLQKIAEVGPAKAKLLVEEYGIRTMDQLNKNINLLNDKQKIGFKYWKTDQIRIPRDEILKHKKLYEASVTLLNGLDNVSFTITGSFRRGALNSGDIDILLTHPNDKREYFNQFVDSLISQGYLIDNLAYGDKKYMGYGKLFSKDNIPRRIDIIYCPPNEYPFAILYFTGSGSFNVKMREYASKKGFRLNEKGLIDLKTQKGVNHTFTSEEDIFAYLGLTYVQPNDRIETYKF
jgi:DNA polymerase/3'-5' exonuclease PolX